VNVVIRLGSIVVNIGVVFKCVNRANALEIEKREENRALVK
jgi:hypothetical protein